MPSIVVDAQDWTLTRATTVVADAIAGVGVEQAHVVGVSLGGMLAQSPALSRPSSVRSLTLMDTAATFAEAGRSAVRDRAGTAREHGMAAVIQGLIDRPSPPHAPCATPSP